MTTRDEPGDERDLTVGPLIVDRDELDDAASDDGAPLGGPELESVPPRLKAVLREALAVIEEAVPGHGRKWIGAWKLFTLRTPPPRPRMFAYVTVLVDRVRIGIEDGFEDPLGLFEKVASRRWRQRDLREVREVRVKGFIEQMKRAAAFVPEKKPRGAGRAK